jgi:hypothetical protein
MTPEEKAEELYYKYSMKGLEEIKSVLNRVVRKNIAKQCAIIAVDEILDLNLGCSHDESLWDEAEFYERVKQELEKL